MRTLLGLQVCGHNFIKQMQRLISPHSCGCAWCRYESQMQSQRLRLVSDHEMRLEQHEAERKDERRRFEDTIERLRQASRSPLGSPPPAFEAQGHAQRQALIL